jgi:hypothetical protein
MLLPIKSAYSTLIVVLTMILFGVVDAGSTRVFLAPSNQVVDAVGDSFTVNVSISDVSNVYGYGFRLYYNSTVMNGTQVVEGSFLRNSGQTFFWVTNFTDCYDSTHGLVEVTCSSLSNVSGVSGSGVLATIEFKSLAVSALTPLHLANVELSNRNASSIPHEDVDGTVAVVPELTSLVAFLTLMTASLLCILVRKRANQTNISPPLFLSCPVVTLHTDGLGTRNHEQKAPNDHLTS